LALGKTTVVRDERPPQTTALTQPTNPTPATTDKKTAAAPNPTRQPFIADYMRS
jgi:hypothetical protein